MQAVIAEKSTFDQLKKLEKSGKIANRTERLELLTTIMRGEQVGTMRHPRYPDLIVPVFPNLTQRMKALSTLGKIEGDFIVRIEHTQGIDYASELQRLKQLGSASNDNNVIDGDFTELKQSKIADFQGNIDNSELSFI